MRFEWIHPKVCDDSTGVKLPNIRYVKCNLCNSGEYQLYNDTDTYLYSCEMCPEGTFNKEIGADKCNKCEEGYHSVLELNLRNFQKETLDKNFINDGWKVLNNTLTPNILHTENSHVLLKKIQKTEKEGSVIINYTIEEDLDIHFEYLTISLGNKHHDDFNRTKSLFSIAYFKLENDLSDLKIEYHNSKKSKSPGARAPIRINSIKIVNSTEGGGYTCSECQGGYFDKITKQCKKCREGYEVHPINGGTCVLCKLGYYNDGSSTTCKKCPAFTTSNSNCCNLSDALSSKKNQLRYVIKDLYHEHIYNETSSFIGPIIDNTDSSYYFISHKKLFNFTTNDFSYLELDVHIKKGHIFGLKKPSIIKNPKIGDKSILDENMRILVNMGSRIEYVKLIKNFTSGIIVKYTDGDVCQEDPTKRYSSYLIITCDKRKKYSNSNSLPFILKKIKTNDCTKVFNWRTKYGCRSCLKKEVSPVKVKFLIKKYIHINKDFLQIFKKNELLHRE
jgi:hypothetical protein